MRLLTLLVPAYLPKAYPGATPTPYQSGTVDQFEKALADLSPCVLRQANVHRLRPDPAGRWVEAQIVTPYQIVYSADETRAGEAIALALKVFKVEKITAFSEELEAEEFDTAAAAEITGGLHPWNEEA